MISGVMLYRPELRWIKNIYIEDSVLMIWHDVTVVTATRHRNNCTSQRCKQHTSGATDVVSAARASATSHAIDLDDLGGSRVITILLILRDLIPRGDMAIWGSER